MNLIERLDRALLISMPAFVAGVLGALVKLLIGLTSSWLIWVIWLLAIAVLGGAATSDNIVLQSTGLLGLAFQLGCGIGNAIVGTSLLLFGLSFATYLAVVLSELLALAGGFAYAVWALSLPIQRDRHPAPAAGLILTVEPIHRST